MNWYVGSIQDAIATSKRRKAYFIVYVEGNDELSISMTKVLDSPEIANKFEANNFVAIKLAKDSEGHKQFEAFYKLVPVPSLFFIDQNGSPVEIVVSDKSEETVRNKVNNAIMKCVPNMETASVSSSVTSVPLVDQPSTSASSFSSDFISAESAASCISAEPSTSSSTDINSSSASLKLTEDSVQEKLPADNPTSGNMEDKSIKPKEIQKQPEPPKSAATNPPTEVKASIEERVEKAKLLLEKKKEQKTLEEMKNEKKSELERRRVGQELLLAKREQQDRELRQLREEREREKKEEALARQRILDQIAQDRADRAERQNIISRPSQENSNASNPADVSAAEAPTPPAPASAANANIARLQFKLPSGETKSHTFTRETTLAQVRQFIDNNIVIPFGSNYQLATTFPRREFTARDNSRTLSELQLIPSAVILIIPTSGTLTGRPSFGWAQMIIDMFWDLTTPVISLSRYVCNLIFGRRNTSNTAGGSSGPSSTSSTGSNTRSGGPATANTAATAPAFNPAVAQRLGGTSTIKKRGNIYSLREHRDDDEDNNTWNGNSTQQM